MKKSIIYSFLIMLLCSMTIVAQSEPLLDPTCTIDQIEGNSEILTIHYSTTDPLGRTLTTENWRYSTDNGATWFMVDATAISGNEPKTPGTHTLQWNTTVGINHLVDRYIPELLFRMQIQDFTIGNGKWKSLDQLETAREMVSVAVTNGELLAIGGLTENSEIATQELYNPREDKWQRAQFQPLLSRIDLAVAYDSENIYVVGGYHDKRQLGTNEVYRASEGNWQLAASMPTPRQGLSAEVVNGKLYAIGGRSSELLATNEFYDLASNSWTTATPMKTARQSFATANLGGTIYAFGGHNNGYLSSVEAYDIFRDRWHEVASMPTARFGHSAIALNGKIYVIGGNSGDGVVSSVEEYDPATNSWKRLIDMPTPRRDFAVASIDGKILAIGGANNREKLSSVEELTLPRTSTIAMSKHFTLANHIKIAFERSQERIFGKTAEIYGTAGGDGLQSWTLDLYDGNEFKVVGFSTEPIDGGILGNFDTSIYPDGDYEIRLRVTDRNALMVVRYALIQIDKTAPELQELAIRGVSLEHNFIGNGTSLSVSGHADREAKVIVATVIYGESGSVTSDVSTSVRINEFGEVVGLINGLNLAEVDNLTLSLTIADIAGNETTAQSNYLVVDNEAPAVKILSPATGAYFSGEPIRIVGEVSDKLSGVRSVELTGGFGWLLVDDIAPITGRWSYEFIPPASDIILSIAVRATDEAGNHRITDPMQVNHITSLPTANIDEPSSDTRLVGDEITISGTAIGEHWKLEYALGEGVGGEWLFIAEGDDEIVEDRFAVWNISELSYGAYRLRLTVESDPKVVSLKQTGLFKPMELDEVALPPNTPKNVEFLDETIPRKNLDSGVGITLSSTSFSDPNADGRHAASQWQLRTDHGSYFDPVYDSGETSDDLTHLELSEVIELDKTYYWRVRHKDREGLWSDYSEETYFSTDLIGRFSVDLSLGLNMISLPLEPIIPMTASTLAEKTGATMVIGLDPEVQEFSAFIPGFFPGDGFPIEGGSGYILNVMEAKPFLFVGKMWDNFDANFSAPQITSSSSSLWAFAVAIETPDIPVAADSILVTNLRTNKNSVQKMDHFNKAQVVTFVDLSRKSVVELGDRFAVNFVDVDGNKITEAMEFSVSEVDLSQAVRSVIFRAEALPEQSRLLQNYPNPFNPETWIPFELSESSEVIVTISDRNGKIIRTLEVGLKAPGKYLDRSRAIHWDGRNDAGEKVSSGVYFYNFSSDKFLSTGKMIVVK